MNSMLSRVRAAAQTMATSPQPATARTAIIDIGSNSVRLVVYDGPRRLPFILFNEKVMAGLGASLARTGRIEEEPMERGLRAIGRFAHLCQDMKVAHIRCVATAAVRDATNGDEFITRAAASIDRLIPMGSVRLAAVAEESRLSLGRFRHLFAAEIGMPFQRFVLWRRLIIAFDELGMRRSATEAAHMAGFSDSAHFARTIKAMFGIRASDLFIES